MKFYLGQFARNRFYKVIGMEAFPPHLIPSYDGKYEPGYELIIPCLHLGHSTVRSTKFNLKILTSFYKYISRVLYFVMGGKLYFNS